MIFEFPYPPPGPIDVPGTTEQVFLFCLAYLLLLSLVLLALPQKWMRRLIRIALHLRGDGRIDGEIR